MSPKRAHLRRGACSRAKQELIGEEEPVKELVRKLVQELTGEEELARELIREFIEELGMSLTGVHLRNGACRGTQQELTEEEELD